MHFENLPKSLLRFGFVSLLLAAVQPTTVAWASPPVTATPISQWGYADAYTDHPLVAEARSAGVLTLPVRERMMRAELPLDRALAVVDAIGASSARRQRLDHFVLIGIAGRLVVGPSGALNTSNLLVHQADGRQALLLGWARALADHEQPAALARRSTRLEQAGAVQLLERAVELNSKSQAARLALAMAQFAATEPAQRGCHEVLEMVHAARAKLPESVRLASAQRVLDLAKALLPGLPATCAAVTQRAELVDAPLQLAPPVPEDKAAPSRPEPAVATDNVRAQQGGFGMAVALAAPIFKAWLDDPVVRNLTLRTPLDEVTLATVLKADKTGDRTLTVLNASLHNRRLGVFAHATVAWYALLRVVGLIDADEAQQNRLKISELSPVQALMLGYAYAIGNQPVVPNPEGRAKDASPEALFAQARGGLPLDAQLGPLMMLALPVDREPQACPAATRAEALRVVVAKSQLPAAAQEVLRSALVAIEAGCPTKTPSKP